MGALPEIGAGRGREQQPTRCRPRPAAGAHARPGAGRGPATRTSRRAKVSRSWGLPVRCFSRPIAGQRRSRGARARGGAHRRYHGHAVGAGPYDRCSIGRGRCRRWRRWATLAARAAGGETGQAHGRGRVELGRGGEDRADAQIVDQGRIDGRQLAVAVMLRPRIASGPSAARAAAGARSAWPTCSPAAPDARATSSRLLTISGTRMRRQLAISTARQGDQLAGGVGSSRSWTMVTPPATASPDHALDAARSPQSARSVTR